MNGSPAASCFLVTRRLGLPGTTANSGRWGSADSGCSGAVESDRGASADSVRGSTGGTVGGLSVRWFAAIDR